MSGNVGELCQDWYGPYSSESQTDPTGPAEGKTRVIRGGIYFSNAYLNHLTQRSSTDVTSASAFNGFRLSLTK